MPMAEYNGMPLWTDSILADTVELSNEEFGAYLRLLICAWRTRSCMLTSDRKRLARMIGVTPAMFVKHYEPTVLAFFVERDGNIFHEKQLKIRENLRLNSAAQSARAIAREEQKRASKYLKKHNTPTTTRTTESAPDVAPDDHQNNTTKTITIKKEKEKRWTDQLMNIAERMNADRLVAPSEVNNTMRDALLQQGLVTEEMLRKYQVY
jgi:uncharacterized protein YdaU (DUF1376 family)